MRQTILAVLDAGVLFWGLAIGPFCWVLRDGLGPGSIDSHGAQAVARFLMTVDWGPVLVALIALRFLVRRSLGGRGASRAGR